MFFLNFRGNRRSNGPALHREWTLQQLLLFLLTGDPSRRVQRRKVVGMFTGHWKGPQHAQESRRRRRIRCLWIVRARRRTGQYFLYSGQNFPFSDLVMKIMLIQTFFVISHAANILLLSSDSFSWVHSFLRPIPHKERIRNSLNWYLRRAG